MSVSIIKITENIFEAERLLNQARNAQIVAEAKRQDWLRKHPRAARKYPPFDPLAERLESVLHELHEVWS
jgi:hypothetical protein